MLRLIGHIRGDYLRDLRVLFLLLRDLRLLSDLRLLRVKNPRFLLKTFLNVLFGAFPTLALTAFL